MIILIKPLVDGKKYTVNGHIVYKNVFENWACDIDLSDIEVHAFLTYEKVVINNSNIKKHIEATYRI